MITKKRLEELIKNCAVIYGIEYNQIEIYDLSDNDICMSPANFRDYGLRVFNSLGYWNDIKFEDLFETREDAEWHKEFGCVERTERLVLPTWEENLSINCIFNTPNNNLYSLKTRIKTGYSIEKENPYIIRLEKLRAYDTFFDYEFTKENYTLACRKAKELFLGEKK